MRLIIILTIFISSIYIFPVCYVFYHSHHHAHHADEKCKTCMEIFSIVKSVSKLLKFFNIYNLVVIYLGISCIFFVKIIKKIFYFNNTPTSLKVKLIN